MKRCKNIFFSEVMSVNGLFPLPKSKALIKITNIQEASVPFAGEIQVGIYFI